VCKDSCPYPGRTGPRSGETYGGEGTAPAVLCLDGCSYRKAWTVQAGGASWGVQAGPSLGTSCSTETVGTGSDGEPIAPADVTVAAPPTAAEAAKKCIDKGQGFGTVSGVVVCSGSSGVETTRKDVKEEEKTPVPGGPTEKETTETTTKCKDGQCETTSETNKDNGTGAGGTAGANDGKSKETAKTVQSESAFCSINPNDARCKAGGDQAKFCEANPQAMGCMEAGTPGDPGGEIGTTSAGLSVVSPVALPSDMTCPADVSLPYGMSISWAPMCDAAGMLRPLVLLFAWLGAGVLVVGGIRSGV